MGDISSMCTTPDHAERRVSALGDTRDHAVLCRECRKVETLNISARCDACMDRAQAREGGA